MSESRLRLRAADADDLNTFASLLQDAIVPVADVAYIPGESRFAMVANRFLWEDAVEKSRTYMRVNCGVVFESVSAVRSRGLDLKRRERMLDLLTINHDAGDGGDGASVLTFAFAGEADIQLTISRIDGRLEDLGEPWPTKWRPGHAGADELP